MEQSNVIVLLVLIISVTYVLAHTMPRDFPQGDDHSIGQIIRKVLRASDPINEDNEAVRRLQRGHFYSKDIMPSTIPGQKKKCWERCGEGEVNIKKRLALVEEPTEVEQTTASKRRSAIPKKTSDGEDEMELTIHVSRANRPMMLTAMLVPIDVKQNKD